MRERAQACMGMLGIYKCVGNQDHAETCAGMHGIYECVWATKIMQRHVRACAGARRHA